MPEPPRLVSHRSEEDMRRQRTSEDVQSFTRVLGANMLRVIAGAGKPAALHDQMLSCMVAIEEFSKAHGRWPDDEIKGAFNVSDEDAALSAKDAIAIAG